jgi:dephospho-CoA kinase
MIVVGLTGGVASGKNFVTHQLKKAGAAIFDSDLCVHNILDNDKGVFNCIRGRFSAAIISGSNFCGKKVDRKKLGDLVFGDRIAMDDLEAILHPVVARMRDLFVKQSCRQRRRLVVLNVPLLFEKDIYLDCDVNILVTSSYDVQKKRFLSRATKNYSNVNKNLLIEKFDNILQNQMPDFVKEGVADFIIYNGSSKESTVKQIRRILNCLTRPVINLKKSKNDK